MIVAGKGVTVGQHPQQRRTVMIETRQALGEPCAVFQMDEEGLTLDVSARLEEGALLMTPEEAGDWFKKQWADARLTLHVSTVSRLIMGNNGRQMVRSGDVAWKVAEQSVGVPAAVEAETPALTQETVATAPTEVSSQQAPEGAVAKVEVPVMPAKRTENEEAADPQAVILGLLIAAGKKGMTINALKSETGLNDYQTRRAIRGLKEDKRINERTKGRTATFTSR